MSGVFLYTYLVSFYPSLTGSNPKKARKSPICSVQQDVGYSVVATGRGEIKWSSFSVGKSHPEGSFTL